MIVSSQDFGGSRGEVDGLVPQTPALAPGEGEQRLEQPFLPLAGGDHALAHLPQGGRVCARVSERDLGERALEGDLATQLMSGVGEEPLLRFDRDGGGSDACAHDPGKRHGRTAIARAKEPRSAQAHQLGLPRC